MSESNPLTAAEQARKPGAFLRTFLAGKLKGEILGGSGEDSAALMRIATRKTQNPYVQRTRYRRSFFIRHPGQRGQGADFEG